MKNNKTFLVVISLAVVASLLTLASQSRTSLLDEMGMMQLFNDDEFEEMMEVGTESMVVDQALIEPMMAGEGRGMPFDGGFMPPYYNDDALDVEDRVYQKSSSHAVVVKNVSDYLRGIKEYSLSIGGKVLSSDISSGDQYQGESYVSGSLSLKVPVEKFDEAATRVTENVKKVVNESINASDVTGQLINTTESLQSLKDAKSLKEAALKDAKTEVEKRRYQIEIERLERQIVSAEKGVDRVEQKVEYSSIYVTAADSERYFNPDVSLSVRDEFARAWASAKVVLKTAGYFGIWVLVYSVVWFPIVWVAKKVFGKFVK